MLQLDINYWYDGLGRRIRKWGPVGVAAERRYVWHGWELLAETDASGNAVRRYTHHPEGIDFPIAMREGGTTHYFDRDGQGNVYKVRNSAGTVQSHYRYRAWGDRYNVSTETVASPFTYKGAQEDRETGLVYMRYRYYSPRLERFVNEDPIGLAGGLNVYEFALSSPVNFGDPFGLQAVSDTPPGHLPSITIWGTPGSSPPGALEVSLQIGGFLDWLNSLQYPYGGFGASTSLIPGGESEGASQTSGPNRTGPSSNRNRRTAAAQCFARNTAPARDVAAAVGAVAGTLSAYGGAMLARGRVITQNAFLTRAASAFVWDAGVATPWVPRAVAAGPSVLAGGGILAAGLGAYLGASYAACYANPNF